jgi:hypothetical protein
MVRRLKRNQMPKRLLPFKEVCRRVGVDYEKGKALMNEIVQGAEEGYLVNIPRFGRFWVHNVQPRTVVMPSSPGSRELVSLKTNATFRFHFRVAASLAAAFRMRARGRMKGTG